MSTARQIDNDLYNRMADTWWSENGFLSLLRSAVNPWRVPYFKRIIAQSGIEPKGARALDVGCGGGLLAEEFGAMGMAVTGIDLSKDSLFVARRHATLNHLRVDYGVGNGERLPFANESFEIALCCDTLEHIHNWDRAINEIARVLQPGAILFYDTINRTFASKIRSIKMAQELAWTRYAPANTHVWEMFITPDELKCCLERHGLQNRDLVGTAPRGNPLKAFILNWQFKKGKISAAQLGERIGMREGNVISGSYMGYAIKL